MLMRTLLPARRERPCGSCATEKRDELTTLHVLPSVEDHTLPHYWPPLCITAKMAADVSCGSKSVLGLRPLHDRFSPKNRHSPARIERPFRAKTQHHLGSN